MGWTGGVAILLALSSGAAMLPQVGVQTTQSSSVSYFNATDEQADCCVGIILLESEKLFPSHPLFP